MPADALPTAQTGWRPFLLLALLSVALHIHGLRVGFFFDDHNHLELCARNGYAGLAEGNTFRWNREILRVWWAEQEKGWAYYRPVTVLLRTALLQTFGLNPLPFHIVHQVLYTAVVLLFYVLLRRLGLGPWAAFVGGAFFTMHPVHGLVAPWLGNDMSVLSALGYVLGLITWHASYCAGHRRPGLLVAVLACYALALLTRESGLMLGPVLLVFDACLAGWKWRGRPWGLYGTLALLGVGYLVLRSVSLPPAPLPRQPYFHWPTDPGFVTWLPYKILSDLSAVPWGLPLIPYAEVPWFQARPVATLLALGLVGGTAALFLGPLRRSPALGGLLLGTVLIALPTLLVFSVAYNYYLLTACWAAVLALWVQRLGATRPRLVGSVLGLLGLLYLAGLWAEAWKMHSEDRTEDAVLAALLADGAADYPPGTQIFVVNLPTWAAEVGPALRLATRRTDLEVVALTLSPNLYELPARPEIEVEDDHTLRLTCPGAGWFSGALGEGFHLGCFGTSPDHLAVGPVAQRPAAGTLPFRVEVLERSEYGVRSLRFTFDRPLTDPRSQFFITGSGFPALVFRPWAQPPTSYTLAQRRLNSELHRLQSAVDLTCRFLHRLP